MSYTIKSNVNLEVSPKQRTTFAAPSAESIEDVAAANAIGGIVREDCVKWLERERAGSSASMNGALDYTELRIIKKLREIGWGPQARPDHEASGG